jgi:hypothetical protein
MCHANSSKPATREGLCRADTVSHSMTPSTVSCVGRSAGGRSTTSVVNKYCGSILDVGFRSATAVIGCPPTPANSRVASSKAIFPVGAHNFAQKPSISRGQIYILLPPRRAKHPVDIESGRRQWGLAAAGVASSPYKPTRPAQPAFGRSACSFRLLLNPAVECALPCRVQSLWPRRRRKIFRIAQAPSAPA